MSRWQRYWFAEGGRTALAIVRIAVALSVLLTLARLDTHASPITSQVYRPVGIWMLLGKTAPPDALVSALWIVAWTMTAAMLLGVATRVTTALSFVGAVALASLSFSASQTWSHQYNVVFLAQLALLGARSGDTLSLDCLYRTRVRKQPAHDVPRGYQWSLRLVQLAVVLMFSGAAFHKLMHGHFTLRWALSDNLRHHLLVRFDLAGLDRPPFVDWILAESWRYQTAALLNMCAQASPLLAALFVRRPLVRAFGGLMFLTETLLLGIVVGLWNLHWVPLVAVFIDWERLLRRPVPEASDAPPPSRAVRTWIVVFLTYDLLTAFVPTLDQRLNTFPFTSFPMFATIRARQPYSEHLPYSVVAGSYEAISDVPLDARAQRWLDHAHRTVWKTRSPDELQRRLATVLERAQWFYPNYHIKGLRLWLTVYEAPAFPAPARFEEKRVAMIAELGEGGTFKTLVGSKLDTSAEHGFLELRPTNIEVGASAMLALYPDDLPTPIPLAIPLQGARFDLGYQPLPGNPRYFVVTTGGVPWLAASHETWRWH